MLTVVSVLHVIEFARHNPQDINTWALDEGVQNDFIVVVTPPRGSADGTSVLLSQTGSAPRQHFQMRDLWKLLIGSGPNVLPKQTGQLILVDAQIFSNDVITLSLYQSFIERQSRATSGCIAHLADGCERLRALEVPGGSSRCTHYTRAHYHLQKESLV